MLLATAALLLSPIQAPLLPLARGGQAPAPNVLIVVADDLGVDQLACYGEGAQLPVTPTLDQLAADGVLFRNAYGNPFCSPTRAQIVTGRHGFRTGIGTYMLHSEPTAFALQPSQVTLPELLKYSPLGNYRSVAIGKWHLGNGTVGGPIAPNLAGWNHFAGIDGNIVFPHVYTSWPKTKNGVETLSTTYATTENVDDALQFISNAPQPWIAYVAFNAIHTPLHIPPDGLYVSDVSAADPHLNPRPYYVAAAEALDSELGRLLAGIEPFAQKTHVIFIGDNGSPKAMVVPPIPDHQHKGTPYEGGSGIPLIIRGPAVAQPGSEVDALVQATDLFATVAEMVGIDLAATAPAAFKHDSLSLMPYLADPLTPPLRETAYAEFFTPNGFGPYTQQFRTMRDERYKLILEAGVAPRLYDLLADPYETVNLLSGTPTAEALAAKVKLQTAINQLLNS